MASLELHKEYNSSGESVQDLFDSTEEGFYVPRYQRGYTWGEDNINQLFDDLVLGVQDLSRNHLATTFLGTTILTTLRDKKETVGPGENRAQPTAVQVVIDGQQRISTLALIAIQITTTLKKLLKMLPDEAPYSDIHNAGGEFIGRLRKLYTISLGRGAFPPQKPKIIRAAEDFWTYKGDDTAYGSPVARYIATYIRSGDAGMARGVLGAESGGQVRVRRNIELIERWIDGVCDAHIPDTMIYGEFPIGSKIASAEVQEDVLGFSDEDVDSVVGRVDTDKSRDDYFAAATYQLLLLTHYLLRRCGVNRLQPAHEEWGFDMFQALNATGTPLTVMETYLPQVMQAEAAVGGVWTSSPSCEYMAEIAELFDATATNEKKNQRTNELLRTFALCYEGKKLGNKFSDQRRWLTKAYEKRLTGIEKKREFTKGLAQTAKFYYLAWYMEDMTVSNHINGLGEHTDGEFISLLVRYLRDAKSRMTAPMLAMFYSQAIEDESKWDEFIECVKACAAFFTLWRSARSTAGLDDIYRRYFRGSESPVRVAGHSWKAHSHPVSSQQLKEYFLGVLQDKKIASMDAWIAASKSFLLYTEQRTICRFMLFVGGHDRVPDSSNTGLTSAGTKGSCTLLRLGQWIGKDYRSLEHVAPQNPIAGHGWDPEIYSSNLVHEIGNLILLPVEVNRLVDNREWIVKYLHYCHVGERTMDKLANLTGRAERKGIVLSKRATNALSKVEYNCAVEPILNVGEGGRWGADVIEKRTHQIKEVAWTRLMSWLQP